MGNLVTWHTAMRGRPVYIRLKAGGPWRLGRISKVGRADCKKLWVQMVGGRIYRRAYGEVWYPAKDGSPPCAS